MIWLIAKREIRTRGRSKGFLVITAILFLAVIAGSIFAGLFTGGDDEAREVSIGLTGDGLAFEQVLSVANDSIDPTIVPNATREQLSDGDIDVLFDGDALVWDGFPSNDVDNFVRIGVQQVALIDRLDDLQLQPEQLETLFTEVEIEEERLDGDDTDFGIRALTALVSGIATFMLLQIWGSFMMMGVVEEKQSRVVEVLLSHVKPRTLLSGKVLGLGVLAVFQMAIFVAGLALSLTLMQDIEIPDGVWSTIPLLVLTFLLGFAFYGTAFASVGAMVSRQEDAQSAQIPVMLPLIFGYVIAVSSVGNADNLAVRIGSFLPFTSPVLLPFRNAFNPMPAWQVALSLGILAVSTLVMIRFGAWLYKYSLLRTGSRVRWSEAWRDRGQSELT